MKKIILIGALCISTMFILLSCNKDTEENPIIENGKTELQIRLDEGFNKYLRNMEEIHAKYQSLSSKKEKEKIFGIENGKLVIRLEPLYVWCDEKAKAIGRGTSDAYKTVRDGLKNLFNKNDENKVNAAINYASVGFLYPNAVSPFQYGAASIELLYEITQLNITETMFLNDPVTYAVQAWIESGLDNKYGNSYTKSTPTLSNQVLGYMEADFDRFRSYVEVMYDSTMNPIDFSIAYYSNYDYSGPTGGYIPVLEAYEVYQTYFDSLLVNGSSPDIIRSFTYDCINSYCDNMGYMFNHPIASAAEMRMWFGVTNPNDIQIMKSGDLFVQLVSESFHNYLLFGQILGVFQLY